MLYMVAESSYATRPRLQRPKPPRRPTPSTRSHEEAREGAWEYQELTATSTRQEAAAEKLGVMLTTVMCSWRSFGRVWGRTDRVEGSGELALALGGAIDSGVQGGAAGASLVGWKGARTTNLDWDEVLLLGAPVAKMVSASARGKDTSRSRLPAAAPHRHGREHARGRGKTVAVRWHSPLRTRMSTAMNRSQSLSPSSPKYPF